LSWVNDLGTQGNSQSAIYVLEWNGSACVQQLPGDASYNGVQLVPNSVAQIALAVDTSGHPFVSWQDASSSNSAVYMAGNVLNPGAVYYVNDGFTTGDVFSTAPGAAGNTGLSQSSPMLSIQQVLNTYTLHPGDVILVDTGTYTSPTTILAADQGILILGAPRGGANLQGTLSLNGTTSVELQGLRFPAGQCCQCNCAGPA